MRILLLANPAAGRGRAISETARAAEYLEKDAEVAVRMTRNEQELAESAAEASHDGWDRIVSCGGDGTLHHVVRGLDLSKTTLGILPLGSGNDFATVLGIPRSIREACEVLLRGTTITTDVGMANGRRFLGVAGLGFDSIVARYARDHARFLRGSAIYVYSTLRVLPSFRPREVVMETEGQREEMKIMFVAIGNTERYGGGVRISPGADIHDGKLDACIIHECSRWQLLKAFPGAYRGEHLEYDFVEQRRAERFRFDSPEKLEVFADGELLTTTPVDLSVGPEKLRVVTPPAHLSQ